MNKHLQIGSLSSGTIAGLLNVKDYETIDRIHAEFFEFCEAATKRYSTWQDAWQDYKIKHAIKVMTDKAEALGATPDDEKGIVRQIVASYGLEFHAWFCVCCELANRRKVAA